MFKSFFNQMFPESKKEPKPPKKEIYTAYVPQKLQPRKLQLYETMYTDAERVPEPYHVHCSPELFAQVTAWSKQHSPKECAGLFIVDEQEDANVMKWVWVDDEATMSGGHVSSSVGRGLLAAFQAGYEPKQINGQWHTHPTFDVYFSSTDLKDQLAMMNDSLQGREGQTFLFAVHNLRDWYIRKVWLGKNAEGKLIPVKYQDGTLVVNGVEFGKYVPKVTRVTKPTGNGSVSKADWETWFLDHGYEKTEEGLWRIKPSASNNIAPEWNSDLFDGAVDDDMYIEDELYTHETLTLYGYKWSRRGMGINEGAYIRWQDELLVPRSALKYSDVDSLFELFGVEPYNFPKLAETIEVPLNAPGLYYEVVDRPASWAYLAEQLHNATTPARINDIIEEVMQYPVVR